MSDNNELYERLVEDHIPKTYKQEFMFIAFVIRDHALWRSRSYEWKQFFSNESLMTVYDIVASCQKKVSQNEIQHGMAERLSEELYEKLWPSVQKIFTKTDEQLGLNGYSFEHLIEVLGKNAKRRTVLKAAVSIIDNITADPVDIARQVRQELSSVSSNYLEPSNYLDPDSVEKRIEAYQQISTKKKIKSGIPSIDNELEGGFMYGDFFVLVGPSGSGKSIFLHQLNYSGLQQGTHGVLIGGEMSNETSDKRLDSRVGEVLTTKFRSGNLNERDIVSIRNNIGKLREAGGSLHTYYLKRKQFTIESVYQCLEQLRSIGIVADYVLLDYLLLMSNSDTGNRNTRGDELIRYNVEALNDLSNDFDRGDGTKGLIVGSVTQGKPSMKSSGKEFNAEDVIAYSQAILQSAKIVYANVTDAKDREMGRGMLKTIKAREAGGNTEHVIMPRFDIAAFHDSSMNYENTMERYD